MNAEQVRVYFISRPETLEVFPFGVEPPVFKIKGRMYGFMWKKDNLTCINLKCDPDEARMLREIFEAVTPGWHMNKEPWNTVLLDTSIPRQDIERMIDVSYGLSIDKLKKMSVWDWS